MFSLIGPKRYDAPWKDIESQGWIAPAECTEVRVTLTDEERMTYATAEPDERYRVAASARSKLPVVRALVERHRGDQVLVIGGYLAVPGSQVQGHRPVPGRFADRPGRPARSRLSCCVGRGSAAQVASRSARTAGLGG